MGNIGREVSDDQIPASNSIEAAQKAHEEVWANPGSWRVVAGPYASSVAQIMASQANSGRRWRSLVRPDVGTTIYKGWTDPDLPKTEPRRAYVLAMYSIGDETA